MSMMMMNVDDKASGASARYFHIVLRNGDDDTTATTAMMTTNVDDKALCVSTQHIYIVSRNGDKDGAQFPGIIISRCAEATMKQLLATTNDKCRTARPRARAHYMWHRVRATMSYHSNDGDNDEDTNVDEQAVCIAPIID
jgi:hypothetical protein